MVALEITDATELFDSAAGIKGDSSRTPLRKKLTERDQ